MNSASKKFWLLSWNVRGLGDPDKCTIVRDALRQTTPTIICLQETKLTDCSIFKAATFLPPNMSSSFVLSSASGARGGTLTAWDCNSLSLVTSSVSNNYCLSTTFSSNLSEHSFSVTNIYAPSDHRESAAFLSQLAELAPTFTGPWLPGDFNLIRSSADKNTPVSNASFITAFNDTINDMSLLELPLAGCRFTWSNKRDTPTLDRLDRIFHSIPFAQLFPSSSLQGLTRPTSDHVPILATLSTDIPKSNHFRFENAWLLHPDFLQSVLPAWHQGQTCTDAAGKLARRLKSV